MSFEHRPLPKGQCAVCGSTRKLLLCGGCKVIHYCSRDHQTSDRPSHKTSCTAIKNTGLTLSAEDQKLRNLQDHFRTSVGRFWNIQETRPYMRARFQHLEAVLSIKTSEAVEVALAHALDMHRLCRSDDLGVRHITPYCLLRLNKDQECYDFLKWWATVNQTPDHDIHAPNASYLDIRDADMFETVDAFIKDDSLIDLSHLVAITLLKTRLLAKTKTSGKTDIEARVSDLDSQIDTLFNKVQKENKAMWSSILVPQHDLGKRVEGYRRGDRGEMQLVLNCAYDAWKETPDAIAVVFHKIVGFAGADAEVLRSG